MKKWNTMQAKQNQQPKITYNVIIRKTCNKREYRIMKANNKIIINNKNNYINKILKIIN